MTSWSDVKDEMQLLGFFMASVSWCIWCLDRGAFVRLQVYWGVGISQVVCAANSAVIKYSYIRAIVLTHHLFKRSFVAACFRRPQLFDVGEKFFFYLHRDESIPEGLQKCLLVWFFFLIHRMCATGSATILSKTAETFHVIFQGRVARRLEKPLSE